MAMSTTKPGTEAGREAAWHQKVSMAASPNPSIGNPQRPRTEQDAAGSLPAAALLAFSGGLLDAFLYLTHDKVFAGAMTGNAVLWGISMLSGHRGQVLHHGNPLLAFVCGVFAAEMLHERVKQHAIPLALGCEMAGVLAASLLPPGFPGDLFVFLLVFLAAFQVSSVRKAGQQSYNSTFITGNMRNAVVGLYELLDPAKRAAGWRQTRALGVVVVSFLVGAVASAVLAGRLANHTLWLSFAALLGVLVLALRPPAPAADPSQTKA